MVIINSKNHPPVYQEEAFQAQTLRNNLRNKRRHLSAIKQQQHSKTIFKRIYHSRMYRRAKHIALYLSADGEVDLSLLINQLHAGSKKCYLPVIISKQHAIMAFAPYKKETPLTSNCFGILEPVFQRKQLKTARQLDLILAPLVGFDEQGNRIGMGAGFYDRALQNLTSNVLKPQFIGVAHELQKVSKLQSQDWDVALDAIVTERRLSYFHQ